jgi:tetratricopeptide (TPR) repeat protein
MSLLAATQISKPADEQAFERASVALWRGLLNDPSVQRNGRRGQRQNGVDLFGIRNDDAEWHVGIQCKLKSEGHFLTEPEVRDEVRKALTFKPPLREYYITTTAPDDVAMQELAREITQALAKEGKKLRVFVWGWNTLEEKISEDSAARKAFDPTYGLFSEELLDETRKISSAQVDTRSELRAGFARLETLMVEVGGRGLAVPPGDATVALTAVEAQIDAEIDGYRDLNNDSKTLTALPLLEKLLERVKTSASGRILFRIKANIGHCLLSLGKEEEAAAMLLVAYEHAPDEPKAIANKAFGLLLRGDWRELLTFGIPLLAADPRNEWLAGYLVQAARFDLTITDPLSIIPEPLHGSLAVQIGLVDFARRRRAAGEWWPLARETARAHPLDPHAIRFAAEADIDEISSSERFRRTQLLSSADRTRLEVAAAALTAQWERERVKDGGIRPDDAALCGNLLVALRALGDLRTGLEIARQGLSLAPDDVELITRAVVIAFDAGDQTLTAELIVRLPRNHDSVLLRFQFHAARAEWNDIVRLCAEDAELFPPTEAAVMSATGRLAAIKISFSDPTERAEQISAVARDVAGDARSSIVVAEFARREGLATVAAAAFKAALDHIDGDSHAADRQMVAHHAARRGDWSIVADLLDGHVEEHHDNDELGMLAQAFVNDSPIRQRALSFFERLSDEVRDLPFYLHAQGLMHFNRGALPEAATVLRKAVATRPDLDNYIALFSVLYRLDRGDEIKPIVDGIDLDNVSGSPGQKMFLAQVMRRAGEGEKALRYAYGVLQSAKNDPDACLRYFGLIMMDPEDGFIPAAEIVGVDTWVQLESDRHDVHSFLIEEGKDRPAEDVLSPCHPTAAAALGRKVGDEFEMPVGFGEVRRWRVTAIKHKYLHALHDVMENFEKRFPNARGFYTVAMEEGDIQPALEQVRRVSESSRKVADLYLVQNCPINFVVSKRGRGTIGFVEYIRSLDFDIRTCDGTEVERVAARRILEQHRDAGAVLDTYTAWTAATMDAFDVLKAVFGTIIVPQSVIDELRMVRDEHSVPAERSMTIAWHNGEFIRQEHTPEEAAERRRYIEEQISRIESACEVRPVSIPDEPTELAGVIYQSFGAHALDAANLAGAQHVLVSDDMYFRQYGEAACSAKGVWLQAVYSYARDLGIADHRRYVDLIVGLAWRRHGHLALNADTMLTAIREDEERHLDNFTALANFMGTRNAELRSHINVCVEFLNQLWSEHGEFDLACKRATSILIDRMVRFRSNNWALVLAFIKRGCVPPIRQFIDSWISGHCLSAKAMAAAEAEIEATAARLRERRSKQIVAEAPKPRLRVRRRRSKRR